MARQSKTQIFRGKTLTEALVKAKSELGADFSIVNRRDVREANLFSKLTSGKLGGDCLAVELEVAAARPEPEEALPEKPAPHPLLSRSYAKAVEGAERHGPAARRAMTEAAAPFVSLGETASGISGRLDAFQRELEKTSRENADLRDELRMLITLQARGGVPAVSPQLLECYRLLAGADVSDELARGIVEDMHRENPGLGDDRAAIRRALLLAVARRIPSAGPVLPKEGKPTVVALVGASGVGKSTSVVKLAIQFAMKAQKSVAVINEDLRRPGADGQITNLGRLFGLSVATASEPAEMVDVVRSMSGRDLILVDTGGRSPRDAKGIDRLAEIVRASGADETHLLLSGCASAKTMRETVARYRPTGFNRVMLTKLDECVSFGDVLNVGAELSEGVSYVTTGPDYTKPIEPADSGVLAELVLGWREVEQDAGAERTEGRSA